MVVDEEVYMDAQKKTISSMAKALNGESEIDAEFTDLLQRMMRGE